MECRLAEKRPKFTNYVVDHQGSLCRLQPVYGGNFTFYIKAETMHYHYQFELVPINVSDISVVIKTTDDGSKVEKLFWPLSPIKNFLGCCSLIHALEKMGYKATRFRGNGVPDFKRASGGTIFLVVKALCENGECEEERAKLLDLFIGRCETLLCAEVGACLPSAAENPNDTSTIKELRSSLKHTIAQKYSGIKADTIRRYNEITRLNRNERKRSTPAATENGTNAPPSKRQKHEEELDKLAPIHPPPNEDDVPLSMIQQKRPAKTGGNKGILFSVPQLASLFPPPDKLKSNVMVNANSIYTIRNKGDVLQVLIDEEKSELQTYDELISKAEACCTELQNYVKRLRMDRNKKNAAVTALMDSKKNYF